MGRGEGTFEREGAGGRGRWRRRGRWRGKVGGGEGRGRGVWRGRGHLEGKGRGEASLLGSCRYWRGNAAGVAAEAAAHSIAGTAMSGDPLPDLPAPAAHFAPLVNDVAQAMRYVPFMTPILHKPPMTYLRP